MNLAKFFLILLCIFFLFLEVAATFINLLIMFEKPSIKTFLIVCVGTVFMVIGVRWLVKIFRGAA